VDLLPAIDIRNGRVVRLSQGERARQTVYGDDPLAVAQRFADEGARWIHVVDLDRAFGSGDNLPAVRRIAQGMASKLSLELGGGLRRIDLVREALDLGFARAVIGTAAASEPSFIRDAVAAVGAARLAVAIDARDGLVAVRGWTQTSDIRADKLAQAVVDGGVHTVIYTDIARDGMLGGPDLGGALLLKTAGARVIVSGGIASAGDVRAACMAELDGVIVGRALYEGMLTLPEAIRAAACLSSS
jgi:phosphoribosylformimino-5-aminoimidazole carboxamide ribotide isomerase